MTKQRGFTLIELIIVIIILGILAVTAAPRFFDFAGQARAGAIDGLRGAVESAVQIESARLTIENGTETFPDPQTLVTQRLSLSGGDDWLILYNDADPADATEVRITIPGVNDPEAAYADITVCFVQYVDTGTVTFNRDCD